MKLLSLLSFAGPVIAKALAQPTRKLVPVYLPTDFPQRNKAIDGMEGAGKWGLDIERARLYEELQTQYDWLPYLRVVA